MGVPCLMVLSGCSSIIKQPCLIVAKKNNNQRESLTVKTISTNIFRHINNYITEKHGSKEKNVVIKGRIHCEIFLSECLIKY